MHIGFDITPLCGEHSGVGNYVHNLRAHLLKECSNHDPITPLSHQTATRKLNKTFWMQALLPIQMERHGIEIGHFTNGVAPLLSPCPTIVTIHDMTLWLYPEYHYRRRLLAMRPFIPLAVRRAAAIIAVSQATKADLMRILRVPAPKIHVIHEAPAPGFRPLPLDAPTLTITRQRYNLTGPFVLYVGTIEPRKNLVRLLEAFAQLWHGGVITHRLILVGQRGWKVEPIFAAAERLQLAGAVSFLGYVPNTDLVALYNLADALVFPSLYEGFGLPVVEAMACGTPVLTSNNSSLGEIATGAAVLVDPIEVSSIVDGLRQILADREWQMELREKGLVRVGKFCWQDSARQTLNVYRKCLVDSIL